MYCGVCALPHVDEILSQGDGVRVAGYGDGPVRTATLAFLAVRYPDHSAGYLTDLGYLSTALWRCKHHIRTTKTSTCLDTGNQICMSYSKLYFQQA